MAAAAEAALSMSMSTATAATTATVNEPAQIVQATLTHAAAATAAAQGGTDEAEDEQQSTRVRSGSSSGHDDDGGALDINDLATAATTTAPSVVVAMPAAAPLLTTDSSAIAIATPSSCSLAAAAAAASVRTPPVALHGSLDRIFVPLPASPSMHRLSGLAASPARAAGGISGLRSPAVHAAGTSTGMRSPLALGMRSPTGLRSPAPAPAGAMMRGPDGAGMQMQMYNSILRSPAPTTRALTSGDDGGISMGDGSPGHRLLSPGQLQRAMRSPLARVAGGAAITTGMLGSINATASPAGAAAADSAAGTSSPLVPRRQQSIMQSPRGTTNAAASSLTSPSASAAFVAQTLQSPSDALRRRAIKAGAAKRSSLVGGQHMLLASPSAINAVASPPPVMPSAVSAAPAAATGAGMRSPLGQRPAAAANIGSPSASAAAQIKSPSGKQARQQQPVQCGSALKPAATNTSSSGGMLAAGLRTIGQVVISTFSVSKGVTVDTPSIAAALNPSIAAASTRKRQREATAHAVFASSSSSSSFASSLVGAVMRNGFAASNAPASAAVAGTARDARSLPGSSALSSSSSGYGFPTAYREYDADANDCEMEAIKRGMSPDRSMPTHTADGMEATPGGLQLGLGSASAAGIDAALAAAAPSAPMQMPTTGLQARSSNSVNTSNQSNAALMMSPMKGPATATSHAPATMMSPSVPRHGHNNTASRPTRAAAVQMAMMSPPRALLQASGSRMR